MPDIPQPFSVKGEGGNLFGPEGKGPPCCRGHGNLKKLAPDWWVGVWMVHPRPLTKKPVSVDIACYISPFTSLLPLYLWFYMNAINLLVIRVRVWNGNVASAEAGNAGSILLRKRKLGVHLCYRI